MKYYNPINIILKFFKSCMKRNTPSNDSFKNDWHYTHKKGDNQFFNIETNQIHYINNTR